jgi:uncharacterized protein (DUF4415 family)
MVQRKSVVEKKRTSLMIEVSLLERFQKDHQRFGDFSHVVNDLLRKYLQEAEERKEVA